MTLFMDIESSTRLGLWYEPAEVAQIKNAFICTAIELVHAFDGHVHRIQGDAVMAFFGGAKVKSEDAVVDALNAASTLWLFVKSTVIPMLKAEGYDEDFGIRVGIDYAPDAHWRSFGYPGVDEFSATAFQVDAAAKLQSAAGRNQIMLGQTLVEHLDIPDVITDTKTVFRDGDHQQEVYLLPNHTLPNGSRHNYRQVLLRAEEYLRCSPLAEAATSYTGDPNLQPIQLKMTVHQEEDGPALDEYASSSLVLPKGRHIRFAVSLPFRPRLPYTVTFEVENHGKQAHALAGDSYDNHTTVREIKSTRQHDNIVHWEHTAYRGLHYMTIVVKDCSKTLARRRVGVFIE
ncbi:MAG: adenylate/guanylate cyclase domain-containing protein [Planctomycetota bacterium]